MLKKSLLFLMFTLFVGISMSGCTTSRAIKHDSKQVWKGTKEVSKDAWQGTKKVVHDTTAEE